MKKESSTNLQKYSGIAEQMIKMSLDCPEITKMILDIIYGDEGEGNGISTISQILVKEVECKDYAQDDSNRAK